MEGVWFRTAVARMKLPYFVITLLRVCGSGLGRLRAGGTGMRQNWRALDPLKDSWSCVTNVNDII